MISFASNAVLSKARAMYGKRIREKNYNDLLMCKSVTEIAVYLKRKTAYEDVLQAIDETDIHRGKLEEILRQQLFYDFASLGRYDLSVGEKFFEYLISRAEIERLMHSLMFFKSEKSGDYTYPLPRIFENHTKINFAKLSNIKNYDEFLEAIKSSPYYKILAPLKPESDDNVDLTKVETTLYTYLYKIMFDMINANLKGKDRDEMKDLFNSYIDLNNLIRIIRMKKNYALSKEYIAASILQFGGLKQQQIQKFIDSKDYESMIKDMKNTRLVKKWLCSSDGIDDNIPKSMRFKKCTHYIRFSKSPPVVLMSYIFLKEIEILNITNIIEGIRYKVDLEEIKSILIR